MERRTCTVCLIVQVKLYRLWIQVEGSPITTVVHRHKWL